ncbi:MAG: Glu/Leu/Phe/Val dehydrogenase dimerization domain-containing protein [Thermodesulfobacteriota bacterium]
MALRHNPAEIMPLFQRLDRDTDSFLNRRPVLVIEYTDPEEGFRGWFARHDTGSRLCAGGMRVQQGLDRDHVEQMARNMALKMRIAAINVNGAKCGIDYDPAAPGKVAAMRRFLSHIRPYVETCYSLGPDLNVDMATLENCVSAVGLPSPKIAVARAQGWSTEYFLERSRILDLPALGDWSLGRLRAGFGVAAAVLATIDWLGLPPETVRISIQGFGQLARAAGFTLHGRGLRLTGISDIRHSFVCTGRELPLASLLASGPACLLPKSAPTGVRQLDSEALLAQPCDILVPAAVERTITAANCHLLQCRAVVPGANLAVTREAALMLHERGILVIPDFVAGCAGSLSMQGLYGVGAHPSGADVLAHIERRMRRMVTGILDLAAGQHIPPVDAALCLCRDFTPTDNEPPYRLA